MSDEEEEGAAEEEWYERVQQNDATGFFAVVPRMQLKRRGIEVELTIPGVLEQEDRHTKTFL